jgi:hypothetical protein
MHICITIKYFWLKVHFCLNSPTPLLCHGPNAPDESIPSCPIGFVVKLDLIRDELMDSGTWHWKYAVDGVHVKLNMVEL